MALLDTILKCDKLLVCDSVVVVRRFLRPLYSAANSCSQVDSAGPVGQTLRAVGNTASAVVTKGIVPAAKAVNDFVPIGGDFPSVR